MSGIKALADALSVNASVTQLSLAGNKLEEEGTKAVCDAVKESKTLKELDLSGGSRGNNIGRAAGAKHVADMLGVNASITQACKNRQVMRYLSWESDEYLR